MTEEVRSLGRTLILAVGNGLHISKKGYLKLVGMLAKSIQMVQRGSEATICKLTEREAKI